MTTVYCNVDAGGQASNSGDDRQGTVDIRDVTEHPEERIGLEETAAQEAQEPTVSSLTCLEYHVIV